MRCALVVLAVWVAGCVSSGTGSSTATDGGGVTDGAAAAGDGGVVDDTDAGCLTFGEASAACGFNSDGMVCLLAVTCGLADSDNACRDHCERGTRMHCYSHNDVACLHAAVTSQMCPELGACGFAL